MYPYFGQCKIANGGDEGFFPLGQRMMISTSSFLTIKFPSSSLQTTSKYPPRYLPQFTVFASSTPPISMATAGAGESTSRTSTTIQSAVPNSSITLLFVEMGVGYDQHGSVKSISLIHRVLTYNIQCRVNFRNWGFP